EETETQTRRGRLRVFFGAAPGVGKTHAMLEAAVAEKRAGRQVLVGYVDGHDREEIGRLLGSLEVLPRALRAESDEPREEFDLDAALQRRPSLLLVDELAHANAPGSRHPKRWQDVMELLDAGIDVWATLNVQDLESLNDVVSQVTDVRVSETLP